MKFVPIKFKISIVFICFLSIPSIILFHFSNHINNKILFEQIRAKDLNNINTINTSINNLLSLIEISSRTVANDSNIQNFIESSMKRASGNKSIYKSLNAMPYISKYLAYMPTLSITLMDKDGYIIGEQRLNKERLDYFFGNNYTGTLSSDDATWSKLFTVEDISTDISHSTLSCFFPVKDDKNELLGYVIMYLDERKLYETFSSYDNTVYILDDSNLIISNQDEKSILKGFYAYNNISYSYLIKNTTIITNNIIITTQLFNRFDWQIITMTPFKIIKNQQILNNRILVGNFLLFILLSLVFPFIASHFISKPITKLTRTMHNIDSVSLTHRSNINTKDEIGEMARTFNTMLDRIQYLIKKDIKEQQLKQDLQLQLVQAQINPHFLYNVLGLTHTLVSNDMKELALQSINALTKFYRTSLSNGTNIITIEKEFELTYHYLIIQKLRYIEFIEFSTSLDDGILTNIIPKLTLQPFVENAIYHGLKNRTSKGALTIEGKLEHNHIVITIYDNGIGMTQQQIDNIYKNYENYTFSEHFGISNVIKRLRLFYGETVKILFESEAGAYTKVTLILPLKYTAL